MTTRAGDRGAVVVTGASTGIGYACALRLDQLGYPVFAGVRSDDDFRRLAGAGSPRLSPLIIDVTDERSIAAAAEQVRSSATDERLYGLVNNAGVAIAAPLEFIPLEELRRQLEINVIGQVAVTQAFLPMLRRARGRIVNMSSIGGRVALPFAGPYAASKHALEALSDSLRRELRGTGVQISVIEPGGVATPIWDKGAREADAMLARMPGEVQEVYGSGLDAIRKAAKDQGENGIAPERIADVVAHALTSSKPRTRYPVGRGVRARLVLSSLLPDRAFDKLIARAIGL